MALISSGQIDLVDLTDSRPAVLHLTTSLPKIQTENNGTFSPNYYDGLGEGPDLGYGVERKGLCISPSLYFGQEYISTAKYYNLITYTIDGIIYKYDANIDTSGLTIFVNGFGELIYKKNLEMTNSIMITANIETYTDDFNHYEDIQTQLELARISTVNFFPTISADRDFFSDFDQDNITLTAVLYKNGQTYAGNVTYEWTLSPMPDIKDAKDEIEQNKKVISIDRDWITNIATVLCKIKVSDSEEIYSTQITIFDKTDPLSSQIISSQGMAFTGTNETTDLSCDVYRGVQELTADHGMEYAWYYYYEGMEDFAELKDDKEQQYTSQTIEGISPQSYGKDTITFRCIATYNNQQRTVAQLPILVSPEIREVITPKQNFIRTLSNGELYGEKTFTKEVLFSLVDKTGETLLITNKDVAPTIEVQLSLPEDRSLPIEFNIENNSTGELYWSYKIEVKYEEKENSLTFIELPESTICRIEYTYSGIEFSEDFYLVKSLQGETGETGQAGRGITEVWEYYVRSSSSSEAPESGWSTTVPNLTALERYLWNIEIIKYSDWEGEDLPTENLTPTKDQYSTARMIGTYGRNIVNIANYYYASDKNDDYPTIEVDENQEIKAPWEKAPGKPNSTLSKDTPYLWNFEEIKYSNIDQETQRDYERTTPCIIGVFGADGAALNIKQNPGYNSDNIHQVPGNPGDAYIINGNIYVYALGANNEYKWTDMGQFTGTNGSSSYIHIAYADSLPQNPNTPGSWGEGTEPATKYGFTNVENLDDVDVSNKAYLGKYVDDISTDSNDPSLYAWTLIKGAEGVGIESIVKWFADYPSKTSYPSLDSSHWETTMPTLSKTNRYLWSYEEILYTDNSIETTTPAIIGMYSEDGTAAIQATIESTGGNIFKNGVGSTTLICKLYQNEEEIDINGNQYSYLWYQRHENNSYRSSFGGGKYLNNVDQDDVNNKTTFTCEVQTDGNIVASSQFTIIDLSDPIVSGSAPSTPTVDTLWLDTSGDKELLKRWDGEKWAIVNDTSDLNGKIVAIEGIFADGISDGQTAVSLTTQLELPYGLYGLGTNANGEVLPTLIGLGIQTGVVGKNEIIDDDGNIIQAADYRGITIPKAVYDGDNKYSEGTVDGRVDFPEPYAYDQEYFPITVNLNFRHMGQVTSPRFGLCSCAVIGIDEFGFNYRLYNGDTNTVRKTALSWTAIGLTTNTTRS